MKTCVEKSTGRDIMREKPINSESFWFGATQGEYYNGHVGEDKKDRTDSPTHRQHNGGINGIA